MVKTVEDYWNALSKSDGARMGKCYAENATFKDPVFQVQGADIATMWRGLLQTKGNVKITVSPLKIAGDKASGTWVAVYKLPKSDRVIRNKIRSSFQLKDGQIIAHRDQFSFWKWSGMALGPVGYALGWTPIIRRKVQRTARKKVGL